MDAETGAVIVALGAGVSGLAVGIIGLVQANKARGDAREANGIAVEANRLSAEANELSRSSHEREFERHDVAWQGKWTAAGEYTVRNTGESTAYRGRVVVTVDGAEATKAFEELASDETLVFSFPQAAESWHEEEAERLAYLHNSEQARRTRASGIGSTFADRPFVREPAQPSHSIWGRAVWETRLGTTKNDEWDHRMASVAPE